jgi:peroxiredoxin
MKDGAVVLAILLLAGAPVFGGLDVGSSAPEFALPDVSSGNVVSSKDLSGGKAMVVMFIATQCPYSNAFNRIMADIGKRYADQGVKFVGINSNKSESTEETKNHAKTNGFPFKVLKDPGNKIADSYGATVTPEVFVFNASGKLAYHGAIGNSKQPTTKESEAVGDELSGALDTVLAGSMPNPATTKMFGCTIKRE